MQSIVARLLWITFASAVELIPTTGANADTDDEASADVVAPAEAEYSGEWLHPRVFSA